MAQAFAQLSVSLPVFDKPLADGEFCADAKLYLPEIPDRLERTVHFCSVAAGPIAFVAALAGVIVWII